MDNITGVYEYTSPPPPPSRHDYYYPEERHTSRSTDEAYFQTECAPPSRQAEYPRVKHEQSWDSYYGEHQKYENDFHRRSRSHYVPQDYYFPCTHHDQGQFDTRSRFSNSSGQIYHEDYEFDEPPQYPTHVQKCQCDVHKGYYDNDDEKTDIDEQHRKCHEHQGYYDDDETDIDEQNCQHDEHQGYYDNDDEK